MKQAEKIRSLKVWLASGTINVFGRPFAGKDTHGKEIASAFGAPLIGGGEIIRSNVAPEHVRHHIKSGALAPSEDYLALILPYLSQTKFQGLPLVLSSVGRWYGEHGPVVKAAKGAGHPLKAVIYLDIDEVEMKSRWEKSLSLGDRGKRHDDAEGALAKREAEFVNKTLPVIEHYRQVGLLVEIDGKGKREEVYDRIISGLYDFAFS